MADERVARREIEAIAKRMTMANPISRVACIAGERLVNDLFILRVVDAVNDGHYRRQRAQVTPQ